MELEDYAKAAMQAILSDITQSSICIINDDRYREGNFKEVLATVSFEFAEAMMQEQRRREHLEQVAEMPHMKEVSPMQEETPHKQQVDDDLPF